MKRESRNLDGEVNKEPEPQQLRHIQTKEHRVGAEMLSRSRQLSQVKGKISIDIENQHGDQHQYAAKHSVQKEFDCRIFTPRSAPDANEEVHGQQHQFPKDIEEKKIHGTEDAHHGRIEEKEQREIALYRAFDTPRSEDANRTQEHGQQYHRDTDTIDADKIFNVVGSDPGNFDNELQVGSKTVEVLEQPHP